MAGNEERKERVKAWLKNPMNLILIAVLIFGIGIRIYYFSMTVNQPLWWDEAAYGSLAKNYIHHEWDNTEVIKGETEIRAPLFPHIWSILLMIGMNEAIIRFLLIFIPSILSVLFVYLAGKELYNEKTGIIASAIFSVLWIHLFYTCRLLTDVPALMFVLAGCYFFVKGTREQFIAKDFAISLILLSIGTLIRYPHGIIFFAFLAFLIITGKFGLVRNRRFWISGIIGISPMLIFFIINYISSGNIFPALLGGGAAGAVGSAFAFNIVNFVAVYLKTALFYAFIVGIIFVLIEIFAGYDLITKNSRIKSHAFLLLILIAVFAYFIFIIKGAEDRWLFPMALPLAIISALGMISAGNFIKKFNKYLPVLLILTVLVFGAYAQIGFADSLIRQKKTSYLQLKDGFEWLKDNSERTDRVLIQGMEVYVLYYAEREYVGLPANESLLQDIKGEFMVVQAFSPQSEYLNSYIRNNSEWVPVKVEFFDSAQKQAALVILKHQYNG